MLETVELVPNGSSKHDSKDDENHKNHTQYHHNHLHELVIGTDKDPFNKEELVHTLKGRELCGFVIFYIFAVTLIVLMFEFLKPVLFNPNYPDN